MIWYFSNNWVFALDVCVGCNYYKMCTHNKDYVSNERKMGKGKKTGKEKESEKKNRTRKTDGACQSNGWVFALSLTLSVYCQERIMSMFKTRDWWRQVFGTVQKLQEETGVRRANIIYILYIRLILYLYGTRVAKLQSQQSCQEWSERRM